MCACCLEQVAPHAAAARSKQQHAATTDIAAFAVSNHVALGISDATRAVMGHAFPPQVFSHCTTLSSVLAAECLHY